MTASDGSHPTTEQKTRSAPSNGEWKHLGVNVCSVLVQISCVKLLHYLYWLQSTPSHLESSERDRGRTHPGNWISESRYWAIKMPIIQLIFTRPKPRPPDYDSNFGARVCRFMGCLLLSSCLRFSDSPVQKGCLFRPRGGQVGGCGWFSGSILWVARAEGEWFRVTI